MPVFPRRVELSVIRSMFESQMPYRKERDGVILFEASAVDMLR
jgi:hypothetical protein